MLVLQGAVPSLSLPLSMVMVLAIAEQSQALCQPRPEGTGKECFVCLSGDDANPGTMAQPFRTIMRGIRALVAGDVLSLREGVYVEQVDVKHKHGTASRPIVVRSYPGEQAFIDGSFTEFRTLNNSDWTLASTEDPDAHPDEYVSNTRFTDYVRGAFLERQPYTRLITYHRLEDLRAENETFGTIHDSNILEDRPPGPDEVLDCDEEDNCVPVPYRFPWVYMGPGIWIDPTNPKEGRVHIRLSHTHNNVGRLSDYNGEVDPRQVRLAISPQKMVTLSLRDVSYLRFEHIGIRFGGDYTGWITNSKAVVFDHVTFWASSHGVRTAQTNTDLTFQNCDFGGGLPSWYFRSDGKKRYKFRFQGNDTLLENHLGKETILTLLVPSWRDRRTTIHHCEFHDAHDLSVGGSDVDFHNNWIHNLNDDGLILDVSGKKNVHIHENVILKTLSAISFASQAVGDAATVGGPFYIYRNLIDLREPTAGYRPGSDSGVWRYGNTFKSHGTDGPYALFQNTFLVRAQKEDAAYSHYRNLKGAHRRLSFYNIFVAVNPDAESDKPITFIPSPSFPALTDGNAYFRIGHALGPRYRYEAFCLKEKCDPGGTFNCLKGCPKNLQGSWLFKQSKKQYGPGYEANSIEADSLLQQISPDSVPRLTDELQLPWGIRAGGRGPLLPGQMHNHSRKGERQKPSRTPDLGCCALDSGPLRVGIDGRRSYPDAR